MPFSEHDNVNHPLSLYAATKMSTSLWLILIVTFINYQLQVLDFLLYMDHGKPDMALFKFTKNILEDKPIDVYNHGNHTEILLILMI